MKITNILSLKRVMRTGFMAAACLAFTACQDNTFSPEISEDDNSVTDGILFRCTDMAEVYHGEGNIA